MSEETIQVNKNQDSTIIKFNFRNFPVGPITEGEFVEKYPDCKYAYHKLQHIINIVEGTVSKENNNAVSVWKECNELEVKNIDDPTEVVKKLNTYLGAL